MSQSERRRQLYLSPAYTEKDWNAAFDNGEDWNAAIDMVEDRIKGRWLDAAQVLLDNPRTGLGFAVLALDCVVIADPQWKG